MNILVDKFNNLHHHEINIHSNHSAILHVLLHAQGTKDFEVLVKVKSTDLNDQQGSGTCWSFATTSFIETEALRLGKDSLTLWKNQTKQLTPID